MDFERVVLSSWKLHWLRLNIWSCQPKPTQTIPSPSLTARSLYANWTLAHACPAPKRGSWGCGAPFFDPRGLEDLLRRFHLIAVIGHWEIILMSSGWEQAVMNTARSHIVTPAQGMRAGWLISLSLGPARLESPDLSRTDLCREICIQRDTDSLSRDVTFQALLCFHDLTMYEPCKSDEF